MNPKERTRTINVLAESSRWLLHRRRNTKEINMHVNKKKTKDLFFHVFRMFCIDFKIDLEGKGLLLSVSTCRHIDIYVKLQRYIKRKGKWHWTPLMERVGYKSSRAGPIRPFPLKKNLLGAETSIFGGEYLNLQTNLMLKSQKMPLWTPTRKCCCRCLHVKPFFLPNISVNVSKSDA